MMKKLSIIIFFFVSITCFSTYDNYASIFFVDSNFESNSLEREIVIAVIDTGIDKNNKLLFDSLWINKKEKYGLTGIDDDYNGYIDDIYGYNFYDDNNQPWDNNGHGTHISGIVLGMAYGKNLNLNKNLSIKLMPIKVISGNTLKSERVYSMLSDAILYAVDNGADLVSINVGVKENNPLIQKSVNDAKENGIPIIAAAGNHGQNMNIYPAALDYVISVSSCDLNGQISGYSNYSEDIDIFAVGENIYSFTFDGIGLMSGTSQSSAYITNLVAGLIYKRHLNRTQILEKLKEILE